MQTGVKQVFYFNAGATSLGGYLEEPSRYVKTPCSAALSPTGGVSITRRRPWLWQPWHKYGNKGVTCKSAYTAVSGRALALNGPWEQRVVSEVTKLNILGRIKADRLVAHIQVIHPPEGGGPRRISFAGSHFDNLRVDGKPVTLDLNPGLLSSREPTVDVYNRQAAVQAHIPWPQLSSLAYRQAAAMLYGRNVPQWVQDRYSWMTQTRTPEEPNPAGYSLCSVVNKINGLAQGPVEGHYFELPDVGRVFLGEVVVHPQQASLTMFRAELGCPVKGQVSASFVVSNGETCPPSFTGQESA